jgi:hypothetical protein
MKGMFGINNISYFFPDRIFNAKHSLVFLAFALVFMNQGHGILFTSAHLRKLIHHILLCLSTTIFFIPRYCLNANQIIYPFIRNIFKFSFFCPGFFNKAYKKPGYFT